MVTTASKFFFGLSFLALGAAVLYAAGSDAGLNGLLTLGLSGSVGEHFGYIVLLTLALGSFLLGAASAAFRDADPGAQLAIARGEELPPATPPRLANYWPIIGAFGVGVVVLGVVISSALFVVGLVIAGIAAAEWAVLAWAERATGDPETNLHIRNRFMYPIEIPAAGALAIAAVVLAFSRIFLTVPRTAAAGIAAGLALGIFGLAILLSFQPRLRRGVIAAVLIIGAIVTLGAGIVSAARGSRNFEHHGEGAEHQADHGTDEANSGEGEGEQGLPVLTPAGGSSVGLFTTAAGAVELA